MSRFATIAALAVGCSLVTSISTSCRKRETPERYTGAITAERIQVASERVRLRADWEDTIAQIESQAGAATHGAIDTRSWAVIEGGRCTSLTIRRKRTYVGSVRHLPPIGPEGETDYDECVELARVRSASR